MQRAIHSRFFSRIYGLPKQRDNFRSVIISVYGIYIAVCVCTFKHFVCSFANMFTFTASLRTVSRINHNKFNPIEQSLIFKFCSQICKFPFTKFCPKLFVSPFRSKPDIGKVFNGNTFTLFFCRCYNRFTYCVVNQISRCSFLAREPFQKSFGTSCAFALNRTANLLPLLPIGINPVGRVFNAIRSNDYIGETEILFKKVLVLQILFVSLHQNIYAMDRKEYLRQYHLKTYVPTGNEQGRPRELPNYDFAGIYQLKNTINGKTYIGQAQNILNRFNEHRRNRNGHLIYRDCYLYRAIKKYGWNKFEISVLEKVEDTLLLNEREVFWINELNPEYNMKDGGDCARGWHHTEEAKRKMSETKSKIYLGKNNPFYGKSHSEETKAKIGKSKLGKNLSEEHRANIAKSNKSHLRKKPVLQYTTEGLFVEKHNSVNDAANSIGVTQGTMSSHLTGKIKICKGFIFKYC